MSDTKTMTGKVEKSEAEWRKELTPMQYAVLREKATERPFSGEYEHEQTPGTYTCAGCGQTLFESDAKFDSGCGWPSFTQPALESHVDESATSATAWSGPKCCARSATAISGMCSRTAPARPDCATASIRRR